NEELAQMADVEHLTVPDGVEIYEIDGPFFFGLASKLDEVDRENNKKGLKVRIIRMRKVPFIDSTGQNNLRNLWKRAKLENVEIILSGVTEKVHASLRKSGLANEIGEEHIFPHIIPALEKATELAK
ncbi:MAG: sodium-independent anion transporter, partial [Bacteroidales bacterium]|nr:sodium-independent anion transporter [Bacteroidales bacterium]